MEILSISTWINSMDIIYGCGTNCVDLHIGQYSFEKIISSSGVFQVYYKIVYNLCNTERDK